MSTVRWSGVPTTYRVKYVDGTEVEARVEIMDALRWENNHQGKSLLVNQSLTAMLTCVWYALRRTGQSDVKDFDAWSRDIADFGQIEAETTEDALPDPTSPARSAG